MYTEGQRSVNVGFASQSVLRNQMQVRNRTAVTTKTQSVCNYSHETHLFPHK